MLLTREGVWLRGARGGEVLCRWRALRPLLALPPLFAALVVLAVNRSSLDLRMFSREPGLETGGRVLEHVGVGLDNALHLAHLDEESALPDVQLRVNRGSLEFLERSIHQGDPALDHELGGTKPYVPGVYRDEEGLTQRCDVAYRGRMPNHHFAAKPSLRVRLKRSSLLQGRRFIDLQRPEDPLVACNIVAEELARDIGLLANVSEIVRLFVNRKYFGVYLRIHRPEERLALIQGRLPGVFFKGDPAEVDAMRVMWHTSEVWAIEGDPDDVRPARAVFDRLLAIVDSQASRAFGPADLIEIERLLDVEQWARWSALMAVVGGVHTDLSHNHMLFWCSYQGRLEPVVWDVNAFGLVARPRLSPDVVLHPITDALSRDPRWLHQRNLILRDLLAGPGSAAALRARLEAHVARTRRDLEADPNLTYEHDRPFAASRLDDALADMLAWIDARDAFLREYLAYARVHVEGDPERAGWSRLRVSGAVALRVHVPGVAEPLLLYPGLTEDVFANDQDQGPDGKPFPLPAAMTYVLPVAPGALRFENALTGEAVTPTADRGPELPLRTCSPLDLPVAPAAAALVLGPGEVVLERDLYTAPGQPLILRAGTTVRLAPGVGIVARGPVRAEGRPDAPVVLGAREAGRPWTCLAITGAATAGTRLSHVRVDGGGEGTDGLARFKGMISIYGCPDVEVAGCWVGANATGDDAMNIAESRARIVDTTFEGARSDGLDLDAVTGSLERCAFVGTGNDGLDLSLSRVVVSGCTFRGCGDKGVSVGEGSRVVLRESRLEGCRYGVQLKDGALALLEDCVLSGNGVGVHAYRKKWVFRMPGSGVLLRSRVEGSRVADVSLEEGARLWLVASTAERFGHGEERVVRAAEVPEPLGAWFRELAP